MRGHTSWHSIVQLQQLASIPTHLIPDLRLVSGGAPSALTVSGLGYSWKQIPPFQLATPKLMSTNPINQYYLGGGLTGGGISRFPAPDTAQATNHQTPLNGFWWAQIPHVCPTEVGILLGDYLRSRYELFMYTLHFPTAHHPARNCSS